MRQFGISILPSLCSILCILPLQAQDPQDNNGAADENGLLGAGFSDTPEMPKSIRVTNDGKLEFDSEMGTFLFQGSVVVQGDNGVVLKAGRVLVNSKNETASLTGRVSVKQKSTQAENGTIIPGIQLFANKVLLNAKSKTITLDGDVSIYQGPTLHRGNHAVYNYGTGQLETKGLASGLGPILLESDRFRMIDHNGKKAFVGEHAGITTHDVADPNYWLRSDQTTIYPGDRIIFKNLRLYAGDTPVFWLPYLSQPLDADLGYHFIPGARTNWGLYLLNSYGIMLGGEADELTGEREGAWLLSQWHLDLMSRRGVGMGVDLLDTRLNDNNNLTGFKLYYLNDLDPSLERTSEPRGFVDSNRWKLELKHRIDLAERDQTSTYLDFNLTSLSDRFFLEDFEPGTYKINPNPGNEVGIFHRNPKYLAGLYTRFRLNDFFQTDTRMPELFFDQIKSPILDSPILHEGQTTFGIYDEHLADFREDALRAKAMTLPPGAELDAINRILDDRGYTRFHTWHEFSAPLNPGGKIAVTPRAGIGYTNYWSLDNGANSFDRTHLSAGVDTSVKFTRAYPNLVNEKWGIDGMLHIFQPYANFSQLSTNELDRSFRGIELLTPSTRPRPLEVGRFTATDSLMDWSIIRLGARNRLLTKRDGDSHEWLVMDTYMDIFMNDPEFDRDYSNLYNDIIWQPLPWMKVDLETQFPVVASGSGFREFAGNVTFMPNDSLEFIVGYRQLDNHPILQDSNRIDLRAYARISESWGVGFYQRWELDDSTPEVQQFNVYRDFDSWTASLGFIVRDNRDDSNEYGLMLNFTLKEFPGVRLPLSIDNE
ncbi:MAG: LPS-assembly protein LptD [Akkermansiaceae bacterium]|nr:LPS-assembly protein LptD [Akkermansiaceae bacterium]